MILGYPASAAFYLASFSEWFYRFIYPVLSIPRALPFWIPGIVILGLLVLLNMKGTEESNQFQILVTGLKVALLILFLYGGLQTFEANVITSVAENIDNVAQIGLTSALVFITFFGFSAITTNAEEIKEPGTTIPRAIYLSMGIVTVIYALVVLVIVLGTNVDRVVQEADCDVFVEKFGMGADGAVDSILVPVAGGPHAELATETAGAIARHTGASVRAAYVIDADASAAARQQGESMLSDRTAALQDVTVDTTLLESGDVVGALVDESSNHDLTIICIRLLYLARAFRQLRVDRTGLARWCAHIQLDRSRVVGSLCLTEARVISAFRGV